MKRSNETERDHVDNTIGGTFAVAEEEDGLVRTRKEKFVRNLFDLLSPRYDLFNTLASLGLHQRWRRLTLRAASLRPGETLVDFCCGTGDFLELAARQWGHSVKLVGLDFSQRMLEVAQARLARYALNGELELRLCNVENTDLPNEYADLVTCGFALRNVDDLERTFREMFRILRPGGRAALLELWQPDNRVLRRAFWIYMDRVLPVLARPLVPLRQPLSYLSASVRGFKPPQQVAALLRGAGFEAVEIRSLFFGVCRMYLGWKPGS